MAGEVGDSFQLPVPEGGGSLGHASGASHSGAERSSGVRDDEEVVVVNRGAELSVWEYLGSASSE